MAAAVATPNVFAFPKDVLTEASIPTSAPVRSRKLADAWARHGRVLITLADQGLVSVASFATNFLLLHHFSHDAAHYALYTLAFNLMIWAGEFQATLVFTPHTIRSPHLSGEALRRFHGSTLLHNTAVSAISALLILGAAAFEWSSDRAMGAVLLTLGLGTIVIGLRNYARPYAFTARRPMSAFLLDLAVAVLQIGGVLVLAKFNVLDAWTAVAVVAVSSALPAIVWLLASHRHFDPNVKQALRDLRDAWPQTKWVFLSGMTWNAGMLLYPWLIKSIKGDIAVATWGACFQLACVANPLLMGLQNFIGPRVAEAVTELPRRTFGRYVYRTALSTAAVMTLPAILLSLYADAALSWLTRGAFTGQHVAITFLCLSIVVQAITFTLSRGLFALHRADFDLYCNSLPLITLFTLGIHLTQTFGVVGATFSLLTASLLSAASRSILFAIALRQKPNDSIPAVPEFVEAVV